MANRPCSSSVSCRRELWRSDSAQPAVKLGDTISSAMRLRMADAALPSSFSPCCSTFPQVMVVQFPENGHEHAGRGGLDAATVVAFHDSTAPSSSYSGGRRPAERQGCTASRPRLYGRRRRCSQRCGAGINPPFLSVAGEESQFDKSHEAGLVERVSRFLLRVGDQGGTGTRPGSAPATERAPARSC